MNFSSRPIILLITRLTFLALFSNLSLNFASPLGRKTRTISDAFFEDYPNIEASGLVWIHNAKSQTNPNERDGLLAGVDDEGRIFMINPEDDSEYYITPGRHGDLEGITIDTFLFQTHPHIYVIDEWRFELIRYSYTLSPPHTLTVNEECRTRLKRAIPCHPTNRGVESLTLYKPSRPGGLPAEFLIGLQKGIIYRVDASGFSTGECIDLKSVPGIDWRVSDVAASHYDPVHRVLYAIYGGGMHLAAIDVSDGCLIGAWATQSTTYEGLAIRNYRAFICSDESPSKLEEFVWNPTFATTAVTMNCTSPRLVCGVKPCGSGEWAGPSACSAPPAVTNHPSPIPSSNHPSFVTPSSAPSTLPSEGLSLTPTTSTLPSEEPSLTPTISTLPSEEPSLTPTTSISPSKEPSLTPTTTFRPTISPTSICTDDATWKFHTRNCNWIRNSDNKKQKRFRCSQVDSTTERKAFEACPIACFSISKRINGNGGDRGCIKPQCRSDEDWTKTRGKKRTCKYTRNESKRKARCGLIGDDGIFAYEACKLCDICRR